MEGRMHQQIDEEQPYDGAIQQITPAPENFIPSGVLNLDHKEEIIVSRKPHRNRLAASLIYIGLQIIAFFGIILNYNVFNGFADLILWSLTIATFVSYFRVVFSNPGYIEGSIVMTDAPEQEFNEFDFQPKEEPKSKGNRF